MNLGGDLGGIAMVCIMNLGDWNGIEWDRILVGLQWEATLWDYQRSHEDINTIVNKIYNFEFMRKYKLAILIQRAL